MGMTLTFAIGDIHGKSQLLRRALDAAYRRSPDGGRFIQLGDIVDRGPDSRACIEILMNEQREGWEIITLQGNHEIMMINAIENFNHRRFWVENGGGETLFSYGRTPHLMTNDENFLDYIPEAHLEWLKNLPVAIHDQHRIYVHAGVDRDIPLMEHTKEQLQWLRYHSSDQGWAREGLHIVHGHTPAREPIFNSGRTCLDTYAYETGRIAIGIFDDDISGGPIEVIDVKEAF
jgi:serine/threonine protein phosphatase 1